MVYQDHNAARVRPDILKRLKDGAAICLVSDAGTPLIADPGYKLVREARDDGIKVFPVPGASAVTAALSAAGAPSDRFTFGGFPPPKPTARQNFFRTFSDMPGLLIFYETGNRLAVSLEDMAMIDWAKLGARLRDRWATLREREDVQRALKIIRYAIFAGVVAYLIYRLTNVGWGDVLENLPQSPWFYIFFLLRFLALPMLPDN